ncbi:MAG: hypothetical protein WCT37_03520 [Patescibacteria group bacterium]|jgi:hypothetical protein
MKQQNKFRKIFLGGLIFLISFSLVGTVLAVTDTPINSLNKAAGEGYIVDLSPVSSGGAENNGVIIYYIGEIIGYLLSFLGIIFLLVIIFAGFRWMTAGGNEEQVTEAKSLLKNGIIGMAIILAAGVISLAAFNILTIAISQPI